jgi:hypothetical protein
MKSATIAGLLLLIIGIASLAYQGITYKTHKKVLDLGPIQATKTETHTLPISPVLGSLALVGGVALLVMGARE